MDATGDCRPEPHGLGRVDEADFDLKGSCGLVGLGRDFPHPAGGLHLRVVGEDDLDRGISRSRLKQFLGDVEDSVASVLTRDLHDHLSGTDHFAGLGADGGHYARGVGGQCGVAKLIMGDPRPGLSGNHLALDSLEMLSGAVEFRLRHPAILKKRLLPLEIEARLDQLRLGGGKGGYRSLQGVLLGREIEPGDNLARLYQVANMDGPLVRRGERRG